MKEEATKLTEIIYKMEVVDPVSHRNILLTSYGNKLVSVHMRNLITDIKVELNKHIV